MSTQATDLSNLRHKLPVTGLTWSEAKRLKRRLDHDPEAPAVTIRPEGEGRYAVEVVR